WPSAQSCSQRSQLTQRSSPSRPGTIWHWGSPQMKPQVVSLVPLVSAGSVGLVVVPRPMLALCASVGRCVVPVPVEPVITASVAEASLLVEVELAPSVVVVAGAGPQPSSDTVMSAGTSQCG